MDKTELEKKFDSYSEEDKRFIKQLEKMYTGWAFFVEMAEAPTFLNRGLSLLADSIMVGYFNPPQLALDGGVQMNTYIQMFNPRVDTEQVAIGPPAKWFSTPNYTFGWWLPYTQWMPVYMALRNKFWVNTLSFGGGPIIPVKAVFAYRPEFT